MTKTERADYDKKYRESHRKEFREYSHRAYLKRQEYGLIKNRKYRAKRKELAYKKLGMVCEVCGFSDIRALQIDHIVPIGKQREKDVYRAVLEDKEGKFQILCANHQWIKRYENHEGSPTIEI